MPKVDKIQRDWMGEFTSFEVHFTKKQLFHIKNCPVEIIVYGNFSNKFETLSDIRNMFPQALITAEDALAERKKVLAIEMIVSNDSVFVASEDSIHTRILDKTNPLHKFASSSKMNVNGFGFVIGYKVLNEIRRGKEVLYFPINCEVLRGQHNQVHLDKNVIVIEWTEEKEATLKNIQLQLINMMNQVGAFFSSDPKILAEFLQSGNLKMLNQ